MSSLSRERYKPQEYTTTKEKLRAYRPNKFTVLQGENFPPRLIRSSKSENIPGQFCPVPVDITLPPDKQGTSRAFFYS